MIDSLLGVVKQFAGDAVANNSAIPKNQTNSALQSITDGILGGLKNEATGGNLEQVVGIFTSGNVNKSLSSTIQTSVVNSLMDKIGIQNAAAKKVAAQVVPLVLGALSNKSSDVNLASILGSVTGSSKGNAQSLLDQDGDGKLGLSDIASLLGKSASSGKSSNSGNSGLGGLLGGLGGLLGNKK